MVQVYTLCTHSVVQTLHFSSRVLSVRALCRLLIVALDAQVCPCNPAIDTLWHPVTCHSMARHRLHQRTPVFCKPQFPIIALYTGCVAWHR